MAGQNGFEQLQAWIPQPVIDQINPHATVSSGDARELLGAALSTLLVAAGVLLAMSLIGGFRNLLLSRSLFRKTGRFLAFVRKVSVWVVLATPWWAIWQLTEGEVPGKGLVAVAVLAGLAWLAATATDHSGVWLDRRDATIQIRRGFAIFMVDKVAIRLDRAVMDGKRGQPLGPALADLSGSRAGNPVSLAPEAWQTLQKHLDRVSAVDFVTAALASYNLRLIASSLPAED